MLKILVLRYFFCILMLNSFHVIFDWVFLFRRRDWLFIFRLFVIFMVVIGVFDGWILRILRFLRFIE